MAPGLPVRPRRHSKDANDGLADGRVARRIGASDLDGVDPVLVAGRRQLGPQTHGERPGHHEVGGSIAAARSRVGLAAGHRRNRARRRGIGVVGHRRGDPHVHHLALRRPQHPWRRRDRADERRRRVGRRGRRRGWRKRRGRWSGRARRQPEGVRHAAEQADSDDLAGVVDGGRPGQCPAERRIDAGVQVDETRAVGIEHRADGLTPCVEGPADHVAGVVDVSRPAPGGAEEAERDRRLTGRESERHSAAIGLDRPSRHLAVVVHGEAAALAASEGRECRHRAGPRRRDGSQRVGGVLPATGYESRVVDAVRVGCGAAQRPQVLQHSGRGDPDGVEVVGARVAGHLARRIDRHAVGGRNGRRIPRIGQDGQRGQTAGGRVAEGARAAVGLRSRSDDDVGVIDAIDFDRQVAERRDRDGRTGGQHERAERGPAVAVWHLDDAAHVPSRVDRSGNERAPSQRPEVLDLVVGRALAVERPRERPGDEEEESGESRDGEAAHSLSP